MSRKKLKITTEISKRLPLRGRASAFPSAPDEPNPTIMVGNNNSLEWAIRQLSGNNQGLLWNTGSDLLSVGNNSSLKWNTRQLSPNNKRLLWNTEQTPVEGRAVIGQSDAQFLGRYEIDKDIGYTNGFTGGQIHYGMGFTHRYKNGELRFLTYGYIGGYFSLIEFPAPASYGTIPSATNAWNNIDTIGRWHGIWWDEENQRLWKTRGVDYPDAELEGETQGISTITLNDNGTTSDFRGFWGLSGITSRRIMGGALKIPEWFRIQNSIGKYGVGFGGYASRLSIGPISMGPTLYAIQEPTQYSDNTDISVSEYKVLADHSSGSTTSDWYDDGVPTSFDRGVRPSNVTNEYDTGNWTSPAPDGLGRWVWGDSAFNTGCWIDNDAGTRNRHGYIIVPTFATGRAWYESSTLHYEGKCAEIQVFDPDHIAEVIAGTRQPWNLKPTTRIDITEEMPEHTWAGEGHLLPGGVAGASFDSITGKLYIYCTFAETTFKSHILVYQIA